MIAPLVHSIVSGLAAAASVWYAYQSRKAAKKADGVAYQAQQTLEEGIADINQNIGLGYQKTETQVALAKFHAESSLNAKTAAEQHADHSEECMAVASQHAARADQHSQASQTWSKASELHAGVSEKHKEVASEHRAQSWVHTTEAKSHAESAKGHSANAEVHSGLTVASAQRAAQTSKVANICTRCYALVVKYEIVGGGPVCMNCLNFIKR